MQLNHLSKKFKNNIYFITDVDPLKNVSEITYIKTDSKSERTYFDESFVNEFRGGFWNKTIDRFQAINSFINSMEIDQFFHFELDNWIFDLTDVDLILDVVGSGLFYPVNIVNKTACGNFIYCNNIKVWSDLVDFINLSKNKSDMDLLYSYYLINQSKSIYDINSALTRESNEKLIVDCFEWGHYLFGGDPRNHYGTSFNKYRFNNKGFDPSKHEYYYYNQLIHVKIDSESYKFINLHIHSKRLTILKRRNRVLSIIININKNKRSFINADIVILFKNIHRLIYTKLVKKTIKNIKHFFFD